MILNNIDGNDMDEKKETILRKKKKNKTLIWQINRMPIFATTTATKKFIWGWHPFQSGISC